MGERASPGAARQGTSARSAAAPAAPRSNRWSRSASWAPGLLALRSARHLFWLLGHHTRLSTPEPAAGRGRRAAVEIATTSPPAGIEGP